MSSYISLKYTHCNLYGKVRTWSGGNVLRVTASNDLWIKWKKNNISQPDSRWVSALLTEDIHPNHNQTGYTQQNKKQNQLNSAAAEKWNWHVSQMSEKRFEMKVAFQSKCFISVLFLYHAANNDELPEKSTWQFSCITQQTMSTDLKRAHECFIDGHHASCIVELPTVVGGWEQSDQLSLGKELVAIFNNLQKYSASCSFYQQHVSSVISPNLKSLDCTTQYWTDHNTVLNRSQHSTEQITTQYWTDHTTVLNRSQHSTEQIPHCPVLHGHTFF